MVFVVVFPRFSSDTSTEFTEPSVFASVVLINAVPFMNALLAGSSIVIVGWVFLVLISTDAFLEFPATSVTMKLRE